MGLRLSWHFGGTVGPLSGGILCGEYPGVCSGKIFWRGHFHGENVGGELFRLGVWIFKQDYRSQHVAVVTWATKVNTQTYTHTQTDRQTALISHIINSAATWANETNYAVIANFGQIITEIWQDSYLQLQSAFQLWVTNANEIKQNSIFPHIS